MWFLINNPWILFVLLVVVGFILYVGILIKREVTFNRLLSNKHHRMRIEVPEKSFFTKKMTVLTTSAITPIIVIALVLSISLRDDNETLGDLTVFENGSDVIDLRNDFSNSMDNYSIDRGFFVDQDELVMDDFVENIDATPTYDEIDGAVGSDDYSKVNSQVVGVDEIDNAITDGKYIYTISGKEVVINLAYTDTLEAMALAEYKTIQTNSLYVEGLYVDDDFLVVLLTLDEEVVVEVYDKANDYGLLDRYVLAGNYLGTRKIEENLFVITSENISFDENIDDDLPYYDDGDLVIAEYKDIVYNEGVYPNSYTTFYGIDLTEKLVDMQVVLGDNGYNLYVSETNMYLTGNAYIFEPLADVVNLENPIAETKTAIIKVGIEGHNVNYLTTGFVDGYALNQFSMDEYDDNLRIVTTTVETVFQNESTIFSWERETINRLWILDDSLEVISVIGDGEGNKKLGEEGETVQSSRCIDNYCYIVTFEQTDPFYVVDLSDVENPVVVGALKVPGFSSYLQPLSNEYMLGIGFGDTNGGTSGIKVSIYDISDKENPTVHDEYILDDGVNGYSWSSATYNHKDLLVNTGKGIIAFPYTFTSYDDNGFNYNSGILVFGLRNDMYFESNNYVSHETNTSENVYVYKSLFIDKYLYTLSNKYIKASLISNPEVFVNSLELE